MPFRNLFWGVILIVVGALFMVEEFTDMHFGNYFWPIIMIVSGVLLLIRNQLSR